MTAENTMKDDLNPGREFDPDSLVKTQVLVED
jgi:hypothetical protein